MTTYGATIDNKTGFNCIYLSMCFVNSASDAKFYDFSMNDIQISMVFFW